jgi:Oxidoreductase family, NAD-binding Rossmann fold
VSTHVVIGDGVAGRHHLRVLRALGRSARVLDIAQPDFNRACRAVLDAADGEEIWHVCTPTRTHLDYVRTLVAAAPRPRIILEKPIGRPGESEAFRSCAEQADIVVQSQYGYARVVEALVRLAGEGLRTGPLAIGVVFRKDRAGGGRFVDADRHALGYEGFHQLAIGLRLVEALRGNAAARAFAGSARLSLNRCDVTGFDLGLEADGVRMELSSVLDRDPRSASVGLTDQTGRRLALHFETDRWRTDQPRQLHAIHAQEEEFLIEEDLMQTGVLTCLSALERRDMAGIARNQARALEVEALLDRASEAAGASLHYP